MLCSIRVDSDGTDCDQDAYSRDDLVAEVTSLYEFLTAMYLPEDAIRYPPSTGWPNVTKDSLAFLGKDDAVINLLQRLPYLRFDGQHERHRGYEIYDECRANDYAGAQFQRDASNGIKYFVEGNDEDLPSHVAAIARASTKYGWSVLLNARDGSVEMRLSGYGGTRSFDNIRDFCDYIKNEFRFLKMVPRSGNTVKEDGVNGNPPCQAATIFSHYGWPSTDFDKASCMAEIERAENLP